MIPYGVFPHSEICGSKLICSSPQLIAACHVLHRLLMPRHSPYALVRLNFLTDFIQLVLLNCWVSLNKFLSQQKSFYLFCVSTFRWNCNFTHFLGKTKLISQFCPLKSVRFLLIFIQISFEYLYFPIRLSRFMSRALHGGRSGWTRTIDLTLIRRAL